MARACPSTTGRSKKSQFQCNDVFPLRIVGSNYGLFGVSEESGKLELTASPDREQRDMYILRVKVAVAFCCEVIYLFFNHRLVSKKDTRYINSKLLA